MGDPGAREVARDGGPLGGGRLGEPGAERDVVGVDLQLVAALRVDEPERADRLERLLARVPDLHRDDLVTAGDAEQRLAPVARPPRSGDDDDERALARSPRHAGQRLRELHPRGAVRLVAVAQREEQADQARPALRRRQHALRRSAEAEQPDAVAPDRRCVPHRESHAERDVGLASGRRAERHRRRQVEHDPGDEDALRQVDADVRLRRRAVTFQSISRTSSPRGRTAAPAPTRSRDRAAPSDGRGEQPVDAARDGQLERLAGPRRPAPGRTVGSRLGAECLRTRITRRRVSQTKPRLRDRRDHGVEDVARAAFLRERLVGQDEAVPEGVLHERAEIGRDHVVAAVDERERAGALDERDGATGARAVRDELRDPLEPNDAGSRVAAARLTA